MTDTKKTISTLVGIVFGMFAFGWMLVPIYDVFCEITGLNGKVTGPSYLSEASQEMTVQRDVLIQFMTHPSVSPGRGAEFFHKAECFCFEQQTLAAGERIELPVRFIVDPALPKEIGSLSLGYTLFDITDQIKKNQALANL